MKNNSEEKKGVTVQVHSQVCACQASGNKLTSELEIEDRNVGDLGLSVRAMNSCRKAGLRSLSELVQFALTKDFRSIRNCGKKTTRELEDLAYRFIGAKFTAPKALSSRDKWAATHSISQDGLSLLFPGTDEPKPLKFLEEHLFPGVGVKWRVYRHYLQWDGELPRMEAVAANEGVTRERVRQLMSGINVEDQLAFLNECPGLREEAFSKWVHDGRHFIITEELANEWNLLEGTNWSPLFFAFLVAALSGKPFVRVKWSMLLGGSDANRRLDFTCPLFIEEPFVPGFASAMWHVKEMYQEDRKDEVRISSEGLGVLIADELELILEQALPIGLTGARMEEGVLILPANCMKFQPDLLQEILADFDEETHVDQILEEWNSRFPDRATTAESIRAVALREKELFYSVGRTSTYGLRAWLQEGRPGLRAGTIRDIVEEYLQGQETMMHIDEIELVVKEYRPTTNKSNIMTNLQLEQSGRFVIRNGYVGLAGRNYSAVPAERLEASNELPKSDTPGQSVARPSVEELLSRIESTEELLKTFIINSLPGLFGGGGQGLRALPPR